MLINIKTEEEARQYAIDYQQKVSSCNFSYGELLKQQEELYQLAKKFNLTEEFKENGII